jgi:hypothetical protein
VTNAEIGPHGEIVYFNFEKQGEQKPVKMTWYAGGLKPPTPEELPAGESLPDRGVLFVGDKAKMLCGGAGGDPNLLPASLQQSYERPKKPSSAAKATIATGSTPSKAARRPARTSSMGRGSRKSSFSASRTADAQDAALGPGKHEGNRGSGSRGGI